MKGGAGGALACAARAQRTEHRLAVPPLPRGDRGSIDVRVHDLVTDGDRVIVLWSIAGATDDAVAISEITGDALGPPVVFGSVERAPSAGSSADVIPAPFIAQVAAAPGRRLAVVGPPGKPSFLSIGCTKLSDHGRFGDSTFGLLGASEERLLQLDPNGVHVGVPEGEGPVLAGAFAISRPREAGAILSVAYATGHPGAADVWAARFGADGAMVGAPLRVAERAALDARTPALVASRTIGDRLWIYYREAAHTAAVELVCEPGAQAAQTPALEAAPCACPASPPWDEWIAAAGGCTPSTPGLSFPCPELAPFHPCVRGFPEQVFGAAPRERLLDALEHGDEAHILGALVFLAGRRDVEAAPQILELLRRTRVETGWEIAGGALKALGALAYRPAAPVIVRLIEEKASDCMSVADIGLSALARIGDTSVAPALLRMAKASVTGHFADGTFFGLVLDTLEHLPYPPAVPALIDLARGRWTVGPSFTQVGSGCGRLEVITNQSSSHGHWLTLAARVGSYFARTGEVAGTRVLKGCAERGTTREKEGCRAALAEMRAMFDDDQGRRSVKRADEIAKLLP